ncbi:MAG: hypothetical protein R2792_15225, partial [Saprospiraceae bacterium]
MKKRTLHPLLPNAFVFLTLAWLVLLPVLITAQDCTYPKAQATLFGNALRLQFIQHGGVLQDISNPDGNSPALTHNFQGDEMPLPAGIYSSTFWLACKDSAGNYYGNAPFYPQPYEPYSFNPGPLNPAGNQIDSNCVFWDRSWSVQAFELQQHHADWLDGTLDSPAPAILAWPGKGNPYFETIHGFPLPNQDLAPFYDYNNDGVYNPLDGDFPHPNGVDPDFEIGQLVWNISNDKVEPNTIQSNPPGLEYQFTYWAPACLDTASVLANAVFIYTKISNKSTQTFDSLLVGRMNDISLGAWGDDYFGTDSLRSTIFVYNSDSLDGYPGGPTKNFGNRPPVFSSTLLNHPLHACGAFWRGAFCDGPSFLYNVDTPEEIFNVMNGRWKNGLPITYGSTGLIASNPPTRYLFSGDPLDPYAWSMYSEQIGCISEWIPVSSTYLGTLAPGESKELHMTFAYHKGAENSHLENIPLMRDQVDELRQYYDTNLSGQSCPGDPLCLSDCVWPGDLNTDGRADHLDILPLGVAWSETGTARAGINNWSPHQSDDWGILYNQQFDRKHIDGNGDGHIDSLDLQMILAHYQLSRPDYLSTNSYPTGDAFYFQVFPGSVDPDAILPGQEVMVRTLIQTIPDLYGLAFTLELDTAYWEINDHQLTLNTVVPLRFSRAEGSQQPFAAVHTNGTGSIPEGSLTLNF